MWKNFPRQGKKLQDRRSNYNSTKNNKITIVLIWYKLEVNSRYLTQIGWITRRILSLFQWITLTNLVVYSLLHKLEIWEILKLLHSKWLISFSLSLSLSLRGTLSLLFFDVQNFNEDVLATFTTIKKLITDNAKSSLIINYSR